MKKKQKQIIGCLLVSIGLLVVLNTHKVWSKETRKATLPLKVGVVIYRGDDEFISSLGREIEEELKKVEETYDRKINVRLLDSKNDQSLQNSQVDNFIRNHYDVLCVNMVDRTVSATIVDKAKQADIPVIFFNREPVEEDLYKSQDAYYVGTQAKEAGKIQGQLVIDAYKKSQKKVDKNQDGILQYVMLEGEESHQDSLLRSESSIAMMTENNVDMEKLARGSANWMRKPAYDFMTSWLIEYGENIEVVFSNNDEMALGAIDAIKEHSSLEHGPVVVGIDGTKNGMTAVREDELLGTVLNNQYKQARAISLLSYALGEKKSVKKIVPNVEGRYVIVPHDVVTKETITNYPQ